MSNVATRWLFIRPIAYAVAMTVIAEAFYFVVWGMILFPDGSLAGKAAWMLTCGIAMGSVIGAGTIVVATGRLEGAHAFWSAAIIFFAVGSACAVLCSRIDAQFNYFGGSEHTTLFVLGGIIPAAVGGLLYGWLLYGRPDTRSVSIRL